MKLEGFVGPTYGLNSKSVDSQRCINQFPELIESGTGKEGQRYFFQQVPGLRKILNVGLGPIRLIHIDPVGTILIVSGFEIFRVNKFGDTYSATKIGDLNTQLYATPVKAATIANGANLTTVFVDGTADNYAYQNTNNLTGTFSKFSALGYSGVPNASHVEYLDNFLIFVDLTENRFYVSDWASLNVSPLSFASSEASPDKITSMIVNNRELWILNEKTTEIFYNTGNGDFPFERAQGGVMEKGCVAPYSAGKIEGRVFWLGQDDSGTGIVYSAQGANPQRISTHAIEQLIARNSSLTSITGFTYQKGGHAFYQLNLDGTSVVYDLTTNLWHERCDTDALGNLKRHRADGCEFSVLYNKHYCGDYASNKVYILDENYYLNDLNNIPRIRISPHISNAKKNLFFSSFELDIESGVANTDCPNPVALLSYSDDGGRTWSKEMPKSLGKIGEFKKRIVWRKLGKARDRVFKVKVTDPVLFNTISAEIEVAT